LFQILIEHHAMEMYGVEVELHVFLTLTLDGGYWWASRPSRFTSKERTRGIHWVLDRRQGEPERLYDRCGEENNLRQCRESNSDFTIS
jgi:hypothetical protein